MAESAPARARESLDARVESAVERILEESAAMGADRQQVLSILRRRLLGKLSEAGDTGGKES